MMATMNLMKSKQITEQLELLNKDFPKTLEALDDEYPITWKEVIRDRESVFTLACIVLTVLLMIFW